jgi:NAD(P)-dependent dehydrogenase (short-subunit alcohol dehydrogenase family)
MHSSDSSGVVGAKHALEGAMKCLRMELRPWNVRVVDVNPSYMKTDWIPNIAEGFQKQYQEAAPEIKQQYPEEQLMQAPNIITYLQEVPVE